MKAPGIVSREEWPPDYTEVFAWRLNMLQDMREDPDLLESALAFYAQPENCVAFIIDWMSTYDPRNAGTEIPTTMPFVLFEKQGELVEFLFALIEGQTNGLIEKARDMGATWVACAVSVWLWRFWPGAAIGWGSRKEELVDKLGVPDSIFEKLRMLIRGLPPEFLPPGFNPAEHFAFMRIVNPDNGATIAGEVGDNIGRGGRKLIYFKDESAHYARPELIEAALGDNTNVQVDISSVNGLGNVFHRKREAGEIWQPGTPANPDRTNVFVMEWSDHPAKTPEWYARRKAKAEADGLLHNFAQEVDRSYAASVAGVIIKPEWVTAAIGAAEKLGFEPEGPKIGALDVADDVPGDGNAFAIRQGPCLLGVTDWNGVDTGVATRNSIDMARPHGHVSIMFDSIGVGAGVKAEANRLRAVKQMPPGLTYTAWAASARPLNPRQPVEPLQPGENPEDVPKNRDFFANIKAQGWRELARRFEKTYRAITEGIEYDPDELISIPPDLPKLHELRKELSQPTQSRAAGTMKMVVNKTPSGTKSPNMADAVMMAYWPINETEDAPVAVSEPIMVIG